ncbi:MAG: aminoacyl-tRNA hydrolase [Lentisphaeria bacterium]|nr:aminoacyl-tRNA hydrolase [Lentisphaeria bacterium]
MGLIVGLGNPGEEYDRTRHNAGFMVIDRLLESFPAGRFEKRHTAESFVYAGSFKGKPLSLQKPLTFMNLSGKAVAPIARKLGLKPEEILVIHDDLDLPVGKMRLKCGGSDGGHNGLKSIIAELGSASFKRLRIGIGRPLPGQTVDYVLGKFEEEGIDVNVVLNAAKDAVQTVLTAGMSRAMNQFNAWTPPENKE